MACQACSHALGGGGRLLKSAEKETVDQPNRNEAERENCCGPDRVALNSSMMPRNHFICHVLKSLGAEVVTDILFALLGKFQVKSPAVDIGGGWPTHGSDSTYS